MVYIVLTQFQVYKWHSGISVLAGNLLSLINYIVSSAVEVQYETLQKELQRRLFITTVRK